MWTSLWVAMALAGTQELRDAEWERDVPTIAAFGESESGTVRAEAAQALGRTRSAASLAPLSALARDPDPEVRDAALQGLAWVPGGEVPLREALAMLPLHSGWGAASTSANLRRTAFWALGHHGKPADVQTLVAGLQEGGQPGVGAAEGLARMGRDGVEEAKQAQDALLVAARKDLGPLPEAASYALGRIGCDAEHAPAAARLAQSATHPELRAFLVRAAKGGLEGEALDALIAAGLADESAMVRVSALGAVTQQSTPEPVIAALGDAAPWVQSAAVAALARLGDAGHETLLIRASSDDPWVASDAVAALLASGADVDPAWRTGEVAVQAAVAAAADVESALELATTSEHEAVRSGASGAILEALEGAEPELALSTGAAMLKSSDNVVRAVGVSVLEQADPKAADELLLPVLRVEQDPEVLAEGLALLAAHAPSWKQPPPSLDAVLRRAVAQKSSRVVQKALFVASEAGLVEFSAEVSADPRLELPLSRVGVIRSARVETTRGEFFIELDAETTPLAVWNFSRLAESGFYDDVVFHRVVPAFVVQTGCPRGDGWGGPGWTLPDEVSAIPYEEGRVGMARSDRDTGGSQWFVTTTPQPHLTGDYTLFGTVTRGMPVVRAIQRGDQVLDVVIERVREPK